MAHVYDGVNVTTEFDDLPADILERSPAAVREARAALDEALADMRQAADDITDAEDAGEDHHLAVRRAVESGSKMPVSIDPAVIAARVEVAKRRQTDASGRAFRRGVDFERAVVEHHAAIREAATRELPALHAEARDLISRGAALASR